MGPSSAAAEDFGTETRYREKVAGSDRQSPRGILDDQRAAQSALLDEQAVDAPGTIAEPRVPQRAVEVDERVDAHLVANLSIITSVGPSARQRGRRPRARFDEDAREQLLLDDGSVLAASGETSAYHAPRNVEVGRSLIELEPSWWKTRRRRPGGAPGRASAGHEPATTLPSLQPTRLDRPLITAEGQSSPATPAPRPRPWNVRGAAMPALVGVEHVKACERRQAPPSRAREVAPPHAAASALASRRR